MGRCRPFRATGIEEERRSEVEVVAEASLLVFDHGVRGPRILTTIGIVGIEHAGTGPLPHTRKPLQGQLAEA